MHEYTNLLLLLIHNFSVTSYLINIHFNNLKIGLEVFGFWVRSIDKKNLSHTRDV
jgi:hypothetical protein